MENVLLNRKHGDPKITIGKRFDMKDAKAFRDLRNSEVFRCLPLKTNILEGKELGGVNLRILSSNGLSFSFSSPKNPKEIEFFGSTIKEGDVYTYNGLENIKRTEVTGYGEVDRVYRVLPNLQDYVFDTPTLVTPTEYNNSPVRYDEYDHKPIHNVWNIVSVYKDKFVAETLALGRLKASYINHVDKYEVSNKLKLVKFSISKNDNQLLFLCTR